MASYFEKKKVKKALEKAKELEKKKLLTPKEEVELQHEAVSFSEKLRKLLKPAWFVKDTGDTCEKKLKIKKIKKSKKSVKKTKKKSVKKSGAKSKRKVAKKSKASTKKKKK